jgi:hypothetical protein
MRAPSRAVAMPTTLIALLAALVFLSGCSDSKSSAASGPPPSKLVHKGDTTTVVLSPQAAKHLGVQTAVVSGSRHIKIPYDAVLYEPNGKAVTYTNPAPLQYVRAPVVVDRFKGGTAILKSGPPQGTRVVTVGADEILGVEEGVEGE